MEKTVKELLLILAEIINDISYVLDKMQIIFTWLAPVLMTTTLL